MKNKLSSKEKELWNRISKILWKNWDPIGVYEEESEWDDEYDSYVPHIFLYGLSPQVVSKAFLLHLSSARLHSYIRPVLGFSALAIL